MHDFFRRITHVLAGSLLLLIATCEVGSAQTKRLALIIGNSNYEHTSSLSNPISDARLIRTVLKAHGFQTEFYANATFKQMRRAIGDFGRTIRNAGTDAVAIVYYAGHGVQVNQANYLVPVDAKIDSEGDLPIEGINAAYLMESLSDARAAVNIVILDACRNNPYKTSFRSASRGLARIDGPRGFLIAFSTDPGRVAQDGPDGGNSPYTAALAASLATPGIKIEEALKSVRQRVFAETKGNQVPWESSSLLSDLYVAGGDPKGSQKVEQQGRIAANAKSFLAEELARAARETEKAEVSSRKARAETETAKAEVERATVELARAKAEAERMRVEMESEKSRLQIEQMQRDNEAARRRENERLSLLERQRGALGDRGSSSYPADPRIPSGPLTPLSPYARPSFDCGAYGLKPTSHPDRNPQTDIFCIEPSAARVDNELGEAFRAFLARYPASQRRSIIQEQKNWILLRNQNCPATWPDLEKPERRIELAQCLVNATRDRIRQLL